MKINKLLKHQAKVIILLMDRLQQKQLQKLRQLKQQKLKQQQLATKKMMEDDSVKSIFDYCKRILAQPLTQLLSDYSPSHLSKFVFDQQLQKAKTIFQNLPNQQSTIQHFLLMMISVMNFPFEKWPFYLVGLKDMFNQIVSQKAETITYQSFFKYVIGQVLDFKEEQQNTQFQVRFQQLKKQDYLLHDNGVKKFYYSTDTKFFMTLDQSSPVIKLYNKQMRLAHRFTPNKQKHNKKYPNILHFDYSQMTSRLGIVLSDSTLSIINLDSFLNRSKFQFDSNASNQIVVNFQDKMLQVYYIQMLNKWMLVSDINKLYIFDPQKYKQNDDHYLTQVKIQNDDLKITNVVQLVNLSMICVVAGNQIYFFNENLTQKKHPKYAHSTNIKIFRYCQQTGLFYISGDQKFITIITLIKVSNSFQIKTFDIQSKYGVCTFDVFPHVGTIVVVDNSKEVKLFDMNQGTCYQMASYAHIVKNQKNQIKMFKISKSQFALYQTYTLVFHQEKIAIEKDTQFTFLNRTYYDTAKQEFYLSVNNQIISFSVFQGQIRKSFNMETANVPKHDSFIIGKQTNLFVLDSQKNVYQAYLKQKLPDGQNKSYKKKIGVNTVIDMFYDQSTSHAFVVGPNSIHTIRNDQMNNFTVTSSLSIEKFPLIIAARYNNNQKYILALTNNQQWMVIDAQSYRLKQYYSFVFPIDPNDHQDILIEHFEQDQYYNIDILLTNRNQITLISREDKNNRICLKIQNYLPYKQKSLQFTNMKYCKVGKNNKSYLLLSDKTGYILELNITKTLSKNFKPTQLPFAQFKYPVKDLQTLQFINQKPTQIFLSKIKTVVLDKNQFILFKGHDTQVKILAKIQIQGIRLLTISTDGHIKLWEGQEMLFHLRLPDFKKISWKMNEIEKIKNQRSVEQLVSVLNKISGLRVQKISPQMLLKKNNKIKANEQGKQIKKFNIDQPIQLQIENKDLEQIIHKTHNINWYTYRTDSKKRQLDLSYGPKTNPHPWRTKRQFRKIMEKASPQNKYQKKMPHDLINLRNSLDMRQRSPRSIADIQKELKILPQLNGYIPQKKVSEFKPTGQNQQQENEQAFESCLYVKKKLNKRKLNQFDEIDNQFQKKWLALTARKFIPKSEGKRKTDLDKNKSVGKVKPKNEKLYYYAPINNQKYDPIKQVKNIFQDHNRQTSVNKKGRFIKIPDIRLKRQDLFSTD